MQKKCVLGLLAIKFVSTDSVQKDFQVSTILWIAVHDPEKAVAELAKELWDSFGFSVCIDYSGIFNALSHEHHHIRAAAAEALTAALDKNRDKVKETLSILFQLYILYLDPGVEFGDTNWVGRQGIALALHSVADVLSSKDLPDVMMFLILHALASDNETYFLFRKCYIVLTEAIAQHLATDDPKVYMAAKKLLDELIMSAQSFQGVPNLRKMHLSLSYEPLLSYIQSGGTLFDVVRFSKSLASALGGQKYFVSLGEKGRNIFSMLFRLVETYHVRNKCIRRFDITRLRYFPLVNSLLFTEEVGEQGFTTENYNLNILDSGSVLEYLRFSPQKLEKKEAEILELDRAKSILPPYLNILVAKTKGKSVKTKDKSVQIDSCTVKWRSVYRLDLAGKSPYARSLLLLGVDLHRDYLSENDRENFDNCLGSTPRNWIVIGSAVPSVNAILCFSSYDGTSVQSRWQCGRNHQSHAKGNKLSEKVAEAIFSALYCKELSNIPVVLIQTYVEPKPEEEAVENRHAIMDILNTA